MPQLTPLQSVLEETMLSRSFATARAHIDRGFDHPIHGKVDECTETRGIVRAIERRVARAVGNFGAMTEITILDVGCGSGRAIEEAVRMLPAMVYDQTYRSMRVNIRGIGVDVNPLPHLIPASTFQINPDIDYDEPVTESPTGILADIHTDDATTLATIPDGSVDILYSMQCLQYVEDVLRALEAGWRVLKVGGEMVFHTLFSTNSEPNLVDIFNATRGAQGVFCVDEDGVSMKDFPDPDLIIGSKKRGATFKGFPFVLEPRERMIVMPDSRYGYAVTGRYVARK